MFNGWLSLAGTEIANAARVEAYAGRATTLMHVKAGMDVDGLGDLLGDGIYRSPALDPAPWFSETRPESAKFYGVLPLEIEGVEDSSRTVNVTELIQDGAAFSLPRRASKEFRVKALLVGEDPEGLDSGRRWLAGALTGSRCDGSDCIGDSFCYLAFKPEFCDYNNLSEYPEYPIDWRYSGEIDESFAPYGAGVLGTGADGVTVNMPCKGDGMQVLLDGLVPGGEYRVTLNMRSSGHLAVSVNGTELMTARRENTLAPGRGTTPWLIDFRAESTTALLRITSATEGCSYTTAVVQQVIVERTGEPATKVQPRFTHENFTEPSTWSYDFNGGYAGFNTHIQTAGPEDTEKLIFRIINESGSDKTLETGAGPQRILRGLEVGRSYTVIVDYTSTSGFPFNPVIAGLDATTYYHGAGWVTMHFTAQATQHYLRIRSNSDVVIPDGDTVTITMRSLTAQTNLNFKYLPPVDQLQSARRHLHGVTLLNGPRTVETFRDNTGLSVEVVEFTMAASRADTYTDTFDVGISPRSTTFLVSTEECKNGEPVRVNLFTNPFFRTGETSGGMAVYQPLTGAYAAIAVEYLAESGWNFVRMNSLNATNDTYIAIPVNSSNGFIDGHTYTVSATFYQSEAQTGGLHAWARSIVVVQDPGILVSDPALNARGFQRVDVSFVKTGTVDEIRLYAGSQGDQQEVFWGAILIEESGTAGDPFDGESRAGAVWEGVARKSTARWTKPDSIIISDPDCTPLPVAPQPPSLIPDCPRTTTEWRRYWLEVPARLSGGWTESIPVVTLTTAENAVRDVRIRFYSNESDVGIEEVAPCSYCGEFYISYVPPGTVMNIDGIARTVIADVRGTGSERAMHLVSDFDYGPVQWPALACDTSYFMTVDIAPNEVLDLDVRLGMALKG